MLGPVEFSSAVIGRREDGDLVIACMDGMDAPLEHVRACVALLRCPPEAARQLVLLLEDALARPIG